MLTFWVGSARPPTPAILIGSIADSDVGLVTTGSGLLGIAFQTPIGAAIDVTRAKRGVIVLTMAAMIVAAAIIFVAPTFWPMAIALAVLAVAGDVFAPAVSALTLGLVTRDKLARRLGRNSAFDHAGYGRADGAFGRRCGVGV